MHRCMFIMLVSTPHLPKWRQRWLQDRVLQLLLWQLEFRNYCNHSQHQQHFCEAVDEPHRPFFQRTAGISLCELDLDSLRAHLVSVDQELFEVCPKLDIRGKVCRDHRFEVVNACNNCSITLTWWKPINEVQNQIMSICPLLFVIFCNIGLTWLWFGTPGIHSSLHGCNRRLWAEAKTRPSTGLAQGSKGTCGTWKGPAHWSPYSS